MLAGMGFANHPGHYFIRVVDAMALLAQRVVQAGFRLACGAVFVHSFGSPG
jgi:hypothetical protein